MKYAIRTLELEKRTLEKVLLTWETEHYPEAKKVRERRLKEINQAIDILKREA